jgi:hypothetical protein
MQTSTKHKSGEAPRKPRRERHVPFCYEAIRSFDTLKETAGDEVALAGLAATLSLWTHAMMQINPASMARIYRAILDAWEDNRCELYGHDNFSDGRERVTRAFNARFIDRYHEVFNLPPSGSRELPGHKAERELLTRKMYAQLAIINAHVKDTDEGEPGTPAGCPPLNEPLPANVVDLNCWRGTHPRQIHNLLFAEQGDE